MTNSWSDIHDNVRRAEIEHINRLRALFNEHGEKLRAACGIVMVQNKDKVLGQYTSVFKICEDFYYDFSEKVFLEEIESLLDLNEKTVPLVCQLSRQKLIKDYIVAVNLTADYILSHFAVAAK